MGNRVILTEGGPESGLGKPFNHRLNPQRVGARGPNMTHGMCLRVKQLCWGSMIHFRGHRVAPLPNVLEVATCDRGTC